jgi:hypothetical protein
LLWQSIDNDIVIKSLFCAVIFTRNRSWDIDCPQDTAVTEKITGKTAYD